MEMEDELLVKYMSGQCTPEEETAVLDYLAENDGNLEDFMNMATAVELQKGRERQSNVRKIWKRLAWGVSAAAAIALLVVVSVFAFHRGGGDGEHFAQQKPTTHKAPESPSTVVADTIDTEGKTTIERNSSENGQSISIHEPKHYADGARKENYANMIYPASRLTSISSNTPSLNFRWSTDAVKVHLTVTTDNGQTIVDEQFENKRNYKMTVLDNCRSLSWHLAFTFSDGSTIEKNGTITVVINIDE